MAAWEGVLDDAIARQYVFQNLRFLLQNAKATDLNLVHGENSAHAELND